MGGSTKTVLSNDAKRRKLLPKGFAVFMTSITCSTVLFALVWLPMVSPRVAEPSPVLLRFSSYLELKAFLNNSAPSWPYYYEAFRGQPVYFTIAESKDGAADYSKTNIQVEGVDEADIVKCDGQYVYVASSGRVLIVKAYPPESAEVVAEIKLNGTMVGLFVNRDRLVVFEDEFREFSIWGPEMIPVRTDRMIHVRVYSVENKKNPVLVRNVSLSGGYFASRIYYANVSDYGYGFTTIVAVNVRDEHAKPVYETFLLGASRGVYVSTNNIYLAIPRYGPSLRSEKTEIHRFRVEGNSIKCEASGEVPGRILNQFSMDEYQETFRIATTMGQVARIANQATSSNNVYVLNMNLTMVGRLENIAPGESIYSARFMGKRCYLVTFKKVDPLFVIGLEDPTSPEVLGKLKIPGYSNYLHPYDENVLLGIGKETLEAEGGDFAWYQGVKISLFDVRDVEHPKEIAKYVIGDRGTESPVLEDHKALLFDKGRNCLAIPVLVAKIDREKYPNGVPPFTYGDYVWQGMYIFNITANAITLRGGVTHIDEKSELLKSGYYFYSECSVKRSLYIGDFLYSVSDKKIKINSLSDLQAVKEVKLPSKA